MATKNGCSPKLPLRLRSNRAICRSAFSASLPTATPWTAAVRARAASFQRSTGACAALFGYACNLTRASNSRAALASSDTRASISRVRAACEERFHGRAALRRDARRRIAQARDRHVRDRRRRGANRMHARDFVPQARHPLARLGVKASLAGHARRVSVWRGS